MTRFLFTFFGILAIAAVVRFLWKRSAPGPALCPGCRLNHQDRCRVPGRPNVRHCRHYRPSADSRGFRVIEGGAEDDPDSQSS